MTQTIIIRLAGGLGNQLFQFFAGVKTAKILHCGLDRLQLDTRFLGNYEKKNDYTIDFIVSKFEGVLTGEPKLYGGSMASRFRIGKILNCRVGKWAFISSAEKLFMPTLMKSKVIVLDGYFQSPSILLEESQRERLRDVILNERPKFILDEIAGRHTIAIHIRRGDYLTSKSAAKLFIPISLNYYRNALNAILKSNSKVLVFSDDIAIASHFAREVGGLNISTLKLTLADEFCLMAGCDDYIIANSTFSWLASYIGRSKNSIIVAPKNWYYDRKLNLKNELLLPDLIIFDN